MSLAPGVEVDLERFNRHETLCFTETTRIANSMRDLDTFLGAMLKGKKTKLPGKFADLRKVVQEAKRSFDTHLDAFAASSVVILKVQPVMLLALEKGKCITRDERAILERALDEILTTSATAHGRHDMPRSFGSPAGVGAPAVVGSRVPIASPFAPQTIGAGNDAPAILGNPFASIKYSSSLPSATDSLGSLVRDSAAELSSATPVDKAFGAPLRRTTAGIRPASSTAYANQLPASESSSSMPADFGGFGAPSPKPIAPARTADKGANNGSDGTKKKAAPAKQPASAESHELSTPSSANKSLDKPIKNVADGTGLKTSSAKTKAVAKTDSSSSEKKKAQGAKSTLLAKAAAGSRSATTKNTGRDASPVTSPIDSGKTTPASGMKKKASVAKDIPTPKKPSPDKKATATKDTMSATKATKVEKFVPVSKVPKSSPLQKSTGSSHGAAFNPFGLRQPKVHVSKFSSLGHAPSTVDSATKGASAAKISPTVKSPADTNTYVYDTANIDSEDAVSPATQTFENASGGYQVDLPIFTGAAPIDQGSDDSFDIEANYNSFRHMASSRAFHQMNASSPIMSSDGSRTISASTPIESSPTTHPQMGHSAHVVDPDAMAPQGMRLTQRVHANQVPTSSKARTKSSLAPLANASSPKSPRNEPAKKKFKTRTASQSVSRRDASPSVSPPRKQKKKQLKSDMPSQSPLPSLSRKSSITATSSTPDHEAREKSASTESRPKLLKKRVNSFTFAAKRRAAKGGKSDAVAGHFSSSSSNGDEPEVKKEDLDDDQGTDSGAGDASSQAELARMLFDDDDF